MKKWEAEGQGGWFRPLRIDYWGRIRRRAVDLLAPVEDVRSPACDVEETEDYYKLTFDLPGLKTSDVKVELTNGELIVTGERPPSGARHWLNVERMHGMFRRSFSLPAAGEAQSVEAIYQDGVLTVVVPKAEAAKSVQIPVREGWTKMQKEKTA